MAACRSCRESGVTEVRRDTDALPEFLDRKRLASETGLPRSAVDAVFIARHGRNVQVEVEALCSECFAIPAAERDAAVEQLIGVAL